MYAVTGGQPIPGENKLSFEGMAKQAGYAASYEFDNSEDLETNIDSVLAQSGPVFVCLKVSHGDDVPALELESTGDAMRRVADKLSGE